MPASINIPLADYWRGDYAKEFIEEYNSIKTAK